MEKHITVVNRYAGRFILLLLVLVMVNSRGFSQVIKGKVTDEEGVELLGATVLIEGTTSGVSTDLSGNYVLDVRAGAYTLRVSYVGFKDRTFSVSVSEGETRVLDVVLEEGTFLSEVVVIGSRNQNRTALETAVPVDIISITDIVEGSPQVEVGQILNYVAPSFSSNNQTIADGTDHVNPASLRGLGVDHVLVLVNGKRRHTSALVNVNGSVGRGSVGTDLNAIPVAAIERIEVLRDGASAQYGSDAIAGVINIVLKEDTDDVLFSATVGEHLEGDGEVVQFNVNYGFKVGDRGVVNLTGQHHFRGRTDRAGEWTGDVFKTSWDGVSSSIYGEDFVEGDLSPFEVGRRLMALEAEAINAQNAVTNNLTDSEQEAMIQANGGRRAFTMKVGQSEVINSALMMNARYDLGNESEVYLFGGLNGRRGLATGFYRLPNQSRTLTSIYPNGFLPEINTRIFDGSVAGGIRGKINRWHADFGNTFGVNAFRFFITNTSNASRGNSTPTSFDAGGFAFSQNTTHLDFSRYFDGALHGINVAFGAMYRVETYEIFAGEEGSYRNYGNVNIVDTLADGTLFSNEFNQTNIFYGRPGGSQVFPGFQPDNELKRNRGNLGLYWDTEFQFTSDFFIDAAVRFEDYTDFGNTFNWKLASRYELLDNLAVRGAVSTGFRAPSLQQRYFNSVSTLFQINSEGENVPNEVGTFSNDSRITKLFGIPNLTNEESFNVSAGFTWSFLDNFHVSVDGYMIHIDNRVVLTGSFDGEDDAVITALLDQANAGSATFFVNGIDTETKGVDFIITNTSRLGRGDLRSSLSANFTETEVVSVHVPNSLNGSPNDFFNHEETGRFEDALPRSKVNLTFDYTLNKFSSLLSFVRFGEVWARTGNQSDPSTWIDQEFDSRVVTDLSIGYDIAQGVKLTVGANNLFDVYPEENREEFRSGERFIYSRRATQFGFNGAYYFTRLNVTF